MNELTMYRMARELTMYRMAREITAPPPGLGPRAGYGALGGGRANDTGGAGGPRGGSGSGDPGWGP
jgi:hypothetical protein